MQDQKRILICPLNWGLGHATRCIPLIRLFLKKNAEVIIAADGRAYELLLKEFPKLKFIRLKGYEIRYPDKGTMTLKMLQSIPGILKGIRKEHRDLEKIIDQHKIDAVISDNRYGLYSKNVRSVLITHQLMIKSPFGEKFLHSLIQRFVNKFDECWIPDHAGEDNLSGDLSHKYPIGENTSFISILSRFLCTTPAPEFNFKIMAIVSGPEPQRSIFENVISEQILQSSLKALVVRGLPEQETKSETKGDVTFVAHLSSEEMERAICASELIISRSGYSTLMDLSKLEKRAIFIPTPGQTEQEYLADSLMKKGIAYSVKQSEFNLNSAMKESVKFTGFKKEIEENLAEKKIDELMRTL
ncbi:MAG: glycosyltransferase [Bacteroidota bacterium]|nr:glycosyltransferase [Bacteroidota bacterium]